MEHRKDENPRTWFRSERVFREEGQWFIRTREGVDVGPFPTKVAAEAEAGALKQTLQALNKPEDAEAAIHGYRLNAQLPDEDLSNLTDYVVKEGSF